MNRSYNSCSFLPSSVTFACMLCSIVTTFRMGFADASCRSAAVHKGAAS
eukprot:CAMPEP_0179042976 /NCGR_PEP_ID=MMETSP0796-20121207/16933_1 /TAXON_ID=73915 /ORGANISM="Pyrodinium bahamense, Strain pbaha01" /LENGTH=48 /DNA_ID= /DNA_START= /DNA_END= /DNA_ORIENTATION=